MRQIADSNPSQLSDHKAPEEEEEDEEDVISGIRYDFTLSLSRACSMVFFLGFGIWVLGQLGSPALIQRTGISTRYTFIKYVEPCPAQPSLKLLPFFISLYHCLGIMA
ncbi:hypothetical protein CMV_012873 [Castanea mollissima]|uniref:Uncharacterized protein n=1 Tax=Castanea mollissima TaxID=60419 RepID=A0A8J4VMH3_9ROSI|nr:hypothetical protein CMV_012873 [Castanea mollissima]